MTQPVITDTPMLKQYMEIKALHQDAILFFRLGDFYEMFLDDALIASKALDLTLTGRGKEENRIPMCGIPHHASENYITKLIKQGHKVAICEQVEEASLSKGITKREVVKIITPGTLINSTLLDEKENNYLFCITPLSHKKEYGCSILELSTGEFRLFTLNSTKEIEETLNTYTIKEIITTQALAQTLPENTLQTYIALKTKPQAKKILETHFTPHVFAGFGLDQDEDAYPAAAALLEYANFTQKQHLHQITKLLPLKRDDFMRMDRVTIKNLELTENRDSQNKTGTLFWVLDYTKTAFGGRHLKNLLKNPITSSETLNHRYDAIDSLLHDLLSREELREILSQVYDLERIVTKIITNSNNPRDCIALKNSLKAILPLAKILPHLKGQLFEEQTIFFDKVIAENSPTLQLITLIEKSLKEDCPSEIKNGEVFKEGYSEELDQLILSFAHVRDWIAKLEPKEREATGIKSLKVGFNKVFGYYLEVPQSQTSAIPAHYIRKQTLANAERYITPELKEKETILLHGEEKQKTLEQNLFKEIITIITTHVPDLQALANHLSWLDVFQSLATAAQKHHYVRPLFANPEDRYLNIKDGRHPILETNTTTPFIPNSIHMEKDNNSLMLLTGPNMAGKSTLMRQIALIVVMAQMGSFVPATEFKFSITDQLFTRIGALDNLYFGQSTFMVEMLETATILNNATPQSLIILDEIGRGTSTYDGMSIACAVCEHIHDHIGARTLFATHYHELTALESQLVGLQNHQMHVIETNKGITFSHLCIPGPANKSYGVHVAQMAGLPESVITRATKLLKNLEKQSTALTSHHQLELW